jgi:hypothetical protein
MSPTPQDLRDALANQVKSHANLDQMRIDALRAIDQQRRRLKVQQVVAQAFWILCAILAIGYMWFDPRVSPAARAPVLACFFIIWGGIEILKHRIERVRVETLVEIKYLQRQFAEFRQQMSEGDRA